VIPTDPDTLQTGLGYAILVGLALCALLAIASGFFLVSDINNPARHIENSPIIPSGPQILGPASTAPPVSGVIVSDEYLTTSRALWVAVALTGAAVVAQLFLVSQRRQTALACGED
jgi:hypothetical protein